MTLSALGIFSAAGAGGEVATYELIQTQILTSTQSSIVFNVSSFASTYKHLQLRNVLRSSIGGPADFTRIRFNDDATGYSRHGLQGTGSSVVSFGLTDQIGTEDYPGSTAGANQFGATVIDILDCYSTTKNTTVRMLGGVAGTINFIQLTSGLWIDTSAVSTITLASGNGAGYVAGSRFSIYGIRG